MGLIPGRGHAVEGWRGRVQMGTREASREGVMSTLTTHNQGGQQPQCQHGPLHPAPLTRSSVCPSCLQGCGMRVGGRRDRCRVGLRGKGKKQPEMQSDISRQVMRGWGLASLGRSPRTGGRDPRLGSQASGVSGGWWRQGGQCWSGMNKGGDRHHLLSLRSQRICSEGA